jgi:hypothetical protein
MSALRMKADIARRYWHVRLVPIRDIQRSEPPCNTFVTARNLTRPDTSPQVAYARPYVARRVTTLVSPT